MRFSAIYAGGALAASLVLSACSTGNGTQTVPAISPASAPMGHRTHQGHLVPVGLQQNDGDYDGACPPSSSYFYCYYMFPGTSFSQEWAELDGSGNIIPGRWHWHMPHLR